ncbi:cytochrome-c peroxidase [Gallaecimonas xiamenensis]|uniref:Putative cytochrome-c peroxidase n=1 Tax=Gallaecimonas xiamenensis 3-C-1 TaxID=745411 RepID=K2JFY2_9GAMM|nr:cytochrome c peroxidase [Gallaecimonas xiamenensis]EKE69564.1 putative cytochrome-c peroxidase [Gallaecimonas xiamenensis 3-C-1]
MRWCIGWLLWLPGLAQALPLVWQCSLGGHCVPEDGLVLGSRYQQSPASWPLRAGGQELAALPAKPAFGAVAALGQALFFDPRLSADGSLSCASCHQPEAAFADARRVSVGVGGALGQRNAPSVLHGDLWPALFWDGRAKDLASQAKDPLTNPIEMASSPEQAVSLVAGDPAYRFLWQQAYGDQAPAWPGLAGALAAYQGGLAGPWSAYELFMQGVALNSEWLTSNSLTDQELQGLHLFRTKAGCIRCHGGPLLSDGDFHVTGLSFYQRPFEDQGRYLVTGKGADMGAFRTASLRHLKHSGPWMHNGLFTDLRGIIRFYSHGGARPKPRREQRLDPLLPVTSSELVPFRLSRQEEEALLAFLQAL